MALGGDRDWKDNQTAGKPPAKGKDYSTGDSETWPKLTSSFFLKPLLLPWLLAQYPLLASFHPLSTSSSQPVWVCLPSSRLASPKPAPYLASTWVHLASTWASSSTTVSRCWKQIADLYLNLLPRQWLLLPTPTAKLPRILPLLTHPSYPLDQRSCLHGISWLPPTAPPIILRFLPSTS